MVDTFKTRAQLRERAGKNLAIIEPGDVLSTEDAETFDGLIDPLVAQLAVDEVVFIANTEQIELEYFLPLARLLANVAGPDFGSPINEPAKFADETELRRITATRPTGETLKAKYF